MHRDYVTIPHTANLDAADLEYVAAQMKKEGWTLVTCLPSGVVFRKEAAAPQAKRGPGRPPGSKNKPKEEK